jgi:hypothetical protein
MYVTDKVGAVPVVSRAYGPDGRRLTIGNVANGQVIDVPIVDVIAQPNVFLAPCGIPYIISGSSVINPCGDEIPDAGEPQDVLEPPPMQAPMTMDEARVSLVEMFGTEKAAEALIGAGHVTRESLKALSDAELEELVGPRALSKYHKGLESEAAEAEQDAEPTPKNKMRDVPKPD